MTFQSQVDAYRIGALGDGGADDTTVIQLAVNDAIGAGAGSVRLPAGRYKITSPLIISGNVSLVGDGEYSTIIELASNFSGSAVFIVTGGNGTIRDLSIQALNATYSNNPAAGGIKISHASDWRLLGLSFYYLNGYAIEIISDAIGDSYFPQLSECHTFSCKQGIHLQGTNSSDHNMGAFLVNCNVENCQSGDGLFIEDVHDVTIVNLEGYSIANGNAIHIKGACAAIYASNADIGALVGSAASPTPTVLIEASPAPAYPSQIAIVNSIIEDGIIGLSMTDGSQLLLSNCQFIRNGTDGVKFSGGAGDIVVSHCQFNQNGFTAGSAHYDLDTIASGKIFIIGNYFLTPGGSGSGQVESAIKCTTGTIEVLNNRFAGAPAFVNTFPTLARSNPGYNPIGPLTPPGIPSSTVALINPFGVDCTVHVTGGTVSAIAIGNTATGLTSGTFRVPAGQSIKLTYSVAPAWTWFAD